MRAGRGVTVEMAGDASLCGRLKTNVDEGKYLCILAMVKRILAADNDYFFS